jgi:hypothetical protein
MNRFRQTLAITGTHRVWDVSFLHGLDIIRGSLISL